MGQELTGTQRYASELTRRVVLPGGSRPVLVVPSDAVVPEWAQDEFLVHRSRYRGILFEQLALPLLTFGSLLVNLGGPAPILKRKQIVTMHDASFVRLPETYSRRFVLWYKFLYRSVAKSARQILTVSRFSAGELAEFLNIPVSELRVVPNGSDHMDDLPTRRPDLNIKEDQPYALCVGTLAKHKNLKPVVDKLRDAGVTVVIVGAAGSSRVFQSEGGVSDDRVIVAGRIDDAELKWLYSHATALVFPSLYEGFGLPIVEAQRCGCAVISSDRASLTEVGGSGAVYFPAGSPSTAAEIYDRIQSDQDFRTNLVAEGHRNADRFAWDASASSLSQIIGEVA
ncbi:glycosyltransferase family 4 protein [Arthrobacter sp. zg-Y826]|uniref:glycosyltransferase family 4 protein n=1 Tax=Arthrobacter jinronghuae TaxID=2964609 RepID=UPI002AA2C3A0|nr:glycosyltransferase family 4 protein [Arthrobacter jinronghuae]